MKKLFVLFAALSVLTVNAGITAMYLKPAMVKYQEKQYKKIKVSEVSPEAMAKIKKGYGDYTIKEAYQAADGDYKLILTKDGTDITATFNSTGNLLKIII